MFVYFLNSCIMKTRTLFFVFLFFSSIVFPQNKSQLTVGLSKGFAKPPGKESAELDFSMTSFSLAIDAPLSFLPFKNKITAGRLFSFGNLLAKSDDLFQESHDYIYKINTVYLSIRSCCSVPIRRLAFMGNWALHRIEFFLNL